MILADVLAGYEKELEAIGEEPEAVSFVYRGLDVYKRQGYSREHRKKPFQLKWLNNKRLLI